MQPVLIPTRCRSTGGVVRHVLPMVVVLGAAMLAVVGCRAPARSTGVVMAEQRGAVEPERLVAGRSVEGRPISCQVFGDGDDVVLILAGIHGNEPAGSPLVLRLAEHLSRRPDLLTGCRVVLVPVANPDGLARRTRHNARGVDVNRNFPAHNWSPDRRRGPKPLSEPASRAIDSLMTRYRPARIVSIHQPIACIDYDGPARALAQAMAACGDLPVRKLGGKPGSLGSYAGETIGIGIVTLELPRSASRLTRDQLWGRYGDMLLTAICFPKPIPQGASALASSPDQADRSPASR